MKLLKIHSGPFHRFGSRYAHFFDSNQLLGRGAFDDTWLVKNDKKEYDKKEKSSSNTEENDS